MKLPFKIVLINSGLAFVFSFLFIPLLDSYLFALGVVSFWEGVINLIVGLILLVAKDKRYAQGFLLSSGLLILAGFILCSTAF